MLTFDRIALVVLAAGVWALVLAPRGIVAQNEDTAAPVPAPAPVSHSCDIDGSAYGEVDGSKADIRDWRKVSVECTHY